MNLAVNTGKMLLKTSSSTVTEQQEQSGLRQYDKSQIDNARNSYNNSCHSLRFGNNIGYSTNSNVASSLNNFSPSGLNNSNRMSEYSMSISSRPSFRNSSGRYF